MAGQMKVAHCTLLTRTVLQTDDAKAEAAAKALLVQFRLNRKLLLTFAG